jgi:hypothetical protein
MMANPRNKTFSRELLNEFMNQIPRIIKKRSLRTVLTSIRQKSVKKKSNRMGIKSLILSPHAKIADLLITERGSWKYRKPLTF